MKVYVAPPAHLGIAMQRVAAALKKYAPPHILIVKDPDIADLLVHHVIGTDAIDYKPDRDCAVIQYCCGYINGKNETSTVWEPLWKRAKLVWSYYDLNSVMPDSANFYHAPLGVDDVFMKIGAKQLMSRSRTIGVVSSGYVAGPGAEAIQEVARAADALGMQAVNIGPPNLAGVVGLMPKSFVNLYAITDDELANVYCSSKWVSGLRHIEGFELPVIEGLACGARPIVFNRPDMRQWYSGHAEFVEECTGLDLVNEIVRVMSQPPRPVGHMEYLDIINTFSWQRIVEDFWGSLDA